MKKEKAEFHRGNLTIRGWIYTPDTDAEKYPLVICAHGFNGTPMLHEKFAEYFTQAGFATCIFDFCGGGTRLSSDGDCLDMSIMTELSDMECVYAQLLTDGRFDREKIYLLGESMGGAVARLMAARHPAEIKALLLLYPGLMLPEKFRALYPDRSEIPDRVFHFAMDVGRRYFEDVYDLDMWAEIVKYEGPVYILHGTRDEAVPVEVSYKAQKAYKNARLDTIDGWGHGWKGEKLEKGAQLFTDYLVNTI